MRGLVEQRGALDILDAEVFQSPNLYPAQPRLWPRHKILTAQLERKPVEVFSHDALAGGIEARIQAAFLQFAATRSAFQLAKVQAMRSIAGR